MRSAAKLGKLGTESSPNRFGWRFLAVSVGNFGVFCRIMLKSIELYGFKSFADRARLDLDDGICALVGPNGSGKSNVVDAIKWALGEQSAKRLRGDEMTDVIFNGSASRKALNAAEVTLTFDNRKRALPFDSDEIHLTRRVYRSGESEYLINGQAARLKDFREIVGGVGLGSQGYAVIEQGRVEALLQSSSVQRRGVLEEAAGVSRFNAKKQEVARRLERVEQNLLRLSDLVGEIENQLRKTKAQAGKAESYRLFAARLQKLRTEVGLYDWRLKTQEREKTAVETNDFAEFQAETEKKIKDAEAAQTEFSAKLTEIEAELRRVETELSAVREKIAAEDSAIEFQTVQVADWEAEASRCENQAFELGSRGADADSAARQAENEAAEAKAAVERIAKEFADESAALERSTAKANELAAAREEARQKLQEKNGDASRFAGDLAALETRRRTLEQSKTQKTTQKADVERQLSELTSQFGELQKDGAELEKRRETSFQRLGELKKRREELRRELGARQVEFSELERKRAAFLERSSLLRDLLSKYEGLSPGVKEVLRSTNKPDSPFRNACGLVADLIRVNVEAAPLVELALGQTAQYVVVPPEPELFRFIEKRGARFAGRVGFIWLDPNPSKTIPLNPQFDGKPGVLGRADQFVETEPRFAALVQRLLYRTWIVESIAVAKQLYREGGEPTNFLAADGTLLTADGTLVVGSSQGSAGLISRRSELAALSTEMRKLEDDFEKLQANVAELKEELTKADADFESEAAVQRETTRQIESARLRQTATAERETQARGRFAQLEKETAELEKELEKSTAEVAEKRAAKEAFDAEVATLEENLAKIQRESEALGAERQEKLKRTTNLKIELAKTEERVGFLNDRLKQLADACGDRRRRRGEYASRAAELRDRARRATLTILNGESALALLYSAKEELSAAQKIAVGERVRLERLRSKASFDVKSNRDALEKRREAIRTKEIAAERLAQEIKTLEERLKEDYGIDLSETEFRVEGDEKERGAGKISANPASSPINAQNNDVENRVSSENGADEEKTGADVRKLERIVKKGGPNGDGENAETNSEVRNPNDEREIVVPKDAAGARRRKKEIEELRTKLQELGPVNLEAIETLENLKTRYATLFNQYNDLIAARKSIQRIIERVNGDCRRLFEETFEAVKIYFCNIFQKLFGGGKADLTLEDPSNPLESGVEIVARPPGKELKSLTLMSGGEKSLTCVALLLAIFQYRTSPICILDEVDAALDEGNVNRFANALRDFIPATQFLLVTHSKKTMSSSKSIYGVTMEDSGVSKILSVRFDDVGEDGEILIKAKTPTAEKPKIAREAAG